MLKIALLAGEVSGDILAAALINALKQQYTGAIEFVGIGGKMMIESGLQSWHDMETLSVMGYIEVIKSLPKLLLLRHQVLKQLIAYNPDIFIAVDAPDFNFYLEHKLKQHGIKTVHYISPTIWAWRYERIHKIKKSTDLMLCIFPFEEEIYHREDISAKFIGHPLANDIELDVDKYLARSKLNLPQNKNIFTILSGSRKREVASLAQILISTCKLIDLHIPNSLFVFPFANASTLAIMEQHLMQQPVNFSYQLVINHTRDAIKACDLAIVKSGTVSLETALCKKPMLICYKINKLTEWMVRRKITIQYVGQPNIIAGKEIVKEFLQDDANPVLMSKYIIELFNDKPRQQLMIAEFYKLHQTLRANASTTAATAVLELIQLNIC